MLLKDPRGYAGIPPEEEKERERGECYVFTPVRR